MAGKVRREMILSMRTPGEESRFLDGLDDAAARFFRR
jgi:hypothetical protein